MKLVSSVVITVALTFASLATPTHAHSERYRENKFRNPFLPLINESNEETKLVIWSETERPSTTTTTTSSTSEVTPTNDENIPRRLPTVDKEGCGRIPPTPYVVGGKVAKKGLYSWIALLFYGRDDSLKYRCAGSLITARHVITAAHCIREDLSFVRLGEHDVRTDSEARHEDIPIVKSVVYPQYDPRSKRGDIAILYLERNVDMFEPICMPDSPSLRSKSHVGRSCFVAGWGSTREGGAPVTVLQDVMVSVLDNEICRQSYSKLHRNFTENQFDEAVICAGVLEGGKDSCQGDSGGPLMISEGYGNKYLIGIVSYGYGCAKPGVPGVYTSTQYFMDWIHEMLEDTQ
ncbi:hypothetical protein ACLKA6_015750 [Drosophila palustris]